MGSQQGMTMPGGANVGGLTAEQLKLISNINLDPAARSGLLGVAGQSAAFQPWSPTGAGTLEQMLATGAPTDVGALTTAAQTEGARAFEDFLGGARERFGALNLESSSALEQAKMREAGRLAQGIGETGLRAGVGAAEAATGRRAGALDPALAGAGQRLAGLGQAAGAYGQLGGLGLQAGIGQAGAGQQMLGTFAQPAMGIAQTPRTATPAARTDGPSPVGATSAPTGRRRPTMGYGMGAAGAGYARGGPVVAGRRQGLQGGGDSLSFNPSGQRADLGDYLSQLVFGQLFERPEPQPQPLYQAQLPAAHRPQMGAPQIRTPVAPRVSTYGKRADMSGRRAENDLALLGQYLSSPIPASQRNVFGDPQTAAAWLRYMGPQGITGLTGQSAELTYGTPRSVVGRARGGEVPGMDTGEDYIPAMLRGGELVLTPEVAEEVKMSNSKDPLVRKIQGFLDREPEYTDDGAQFQLGGGFGLTPGGGTQDIFQPEQGLSMTGAPVPQTPGTFSVMGAPPEALTPEARAQKDYESATRLASLLRSAMTLGTQGSAENLMASGIPQLGLKGLEGAEKRVSEERQLSEARKEGEAQRAAQAAEAEKDRKAKTAAQAQLLEAQNIQTLMSLAGQFSNTTPEQAVEAALSIADKLGIKLKNKEKTRAELLSPERRAFLEASRATAKAQLEANAQAQLRSRIPTEGIERALVAIRQYGPSLQDILAGRMVHSQ